VNAETGAESDTERQDELKKHVQSMQSHIKTLSEQIDSLDFVMMFVPVESAFLDAVNSQPNLIELS